MGKITSFPLSSLDNGVDGLLLSVKQAGRHSTEANYRHAWRSFQRFLMSTGIIGSVSLIDASVVERYESWLKLRGVSRNSRSFYLRTLRSMMHVLFGRAAVSSARMFDHVYTGVDKTRKRALGEDVMSRLKQLDLSGYCQLDYARDLFLFSFYARGMSFVDMAYLRKDAVSGGYLSYNRRKTGRAIEVKIEPCMREIMSRREGCNGYLFPILRSMDGVGAYREYRSALCCFNRKLRELSSLVGVPSLSSYMAKHHTISI